MIVTIVLLLLGLALLVWGADFLVKGASRLAFSFGISALVVGLTVVAYGTSAPELAVSVMSSMQGKSQMAVGNIVGSNICNVLLILGLSAMVAPLLVDKQLIRLDVPVMIAASVAMMLLCLDGEVSRLDGLLLFSGAVGYTYWLIRMSRRKSAAAAANGGDGGEGVEKGNFWMNLLWIALGLGLLVLGSHFLVGSAVKIARALGLSETIIGLTIIAVGTSLPELATSVIASFRGERDIAVGNIVGSNVFNILSVAGLSGLVAPVGLEITPGVIRFDLPFMLAVAIACFPIFLRGFVITRLNGLFFFAYYVAYTCYLILGATNHDSLPMFSKVMFEFIAPLTGVMLIGLLIFEWRLHHKKKSPRPDQGATAT
jgi:cation:H+ antiporter